MQINSSFLHLPPHISTSWSQVCALYMQDSSTLVIQLIEGNQITVHDISPNVIENIFDSHAAYLEKEQSEQSLIKQPQFLTSHTNQLEQGIELPIQFGISSLEGIHSAMQHNPAQSMGPELPPEILQKIAAIAKIVSPPDEIQNLPKPEPHCNCMHCQIARAIRQEASSSEEDVELEITADDLHFDDWIIQQTGDKLYTVTHKLDPIKHYSVYLGEPVGCTCGETGCDHVLAILRS
jgi:hypothetical protein